jgi:hypothetical protein
MAAETFWPANRALPTAYAIRPALPCPSCRRTHDARGLQVVRTRAVVKGVAYLEASCCRERFKLPAVEART